MPFHGFPQYQNAALVESANYRSVSVASGDTTFTAAAGDFLLITRGGVSHTAKVVLPLVTSGGPVGVKLTGLLGDGNLGTATVILNATDAAAGVTIDGNPGITLNHAEDSLILASDGSNWWSISKSHNTTDSW